MLQLVELLDIVWITKQKEVAESLNTNVNNNPNAVLDPNQDLIVSNTDNYVKIMFRDDMMFETNSANPTYSASTIKSLKSNLYLKNIQIL